MLNDFKGIPNHAPQNWRTRADRFLDNLFHEENEVLHKLPSGNVHFTAFLEGKGQELITFGAIVLGKLLRGEDVTDLLPSLSDYYHEEYQIYQNGIRDTRSEYWYLMHVNALAAAITRMALHDDAEALARFKNSAERLIQIAHQVQYDLNDQGYDFENQVPYTNLDAFRQPDTIGAYSYLMLMAYETFAEDHFLDEARTAMEKYQSFQGNPWYEIPSGAMACLAAAKLQQTDIKILLDQVIQFALDSEEGSLFVGKWGVEEITGLMRGWRGHSREEASSMAYSLETFILLPYLLPVARYETCYAKLIASYALHVSANARLFYGEYFPENGQGRPDLTNAIPYEALHRNKGDYSPFPTGDFHGQKSIYGGALSIWWGEIIRQTSDPFVLELDLTMSDFLSISKERVCMYYNPYEHDVSVTIETGPENVDLYNLKDHSIVHKNVNGPVSLNLMADDVLIVQFEKAKR